MIVLLRDVHLRLTWDNSHPRSGYGENSKEKFHPSGAIGPARCCSATCSVIRMSRCESCTKNQRATRDSFFYGLVLGDDHIYRVRHETNFRLGADSYPFSVKEQRNVSVGLHSHVTRSGERHALIITPSSERCCGREPEQFSGVFHFNSRGLKRLLGI